MEDEYIKSVTPQKNCCLRREGYSGSIYNLGATPVARRLVTAAAQVLGQEFREFTRVRLAQYHLPAEEFRRRIGTARSAITGEPLFRELIRELLREIGFDPAQTAFDLPRLRAVISGGHSNPKAAPAYSAHRDTWYGNPQAQINCWIPLHDVGESESFAFYPGFFDVPVPNSSASFDYDRWAQAVRWQNPNPGRDAVYPTVLTALDVKSRRGFSLREAEVLIFSAAHLHRTLPNDSGETRFSLDFRAVYIPDHAAGKGAPNVDNHSTRSSLKDYVSPSPQRESSSAHL